MSAEKMYRELKESIRIMKSQRSDIERDKLIKDCKKWELMKLLSKMEELISILKNKKT